jgi:hypothetical protein
MPARQRRWARHPALRGALPGGGGRQIGYQAQDGITTDPQNTIASVKRFMGRSLADVVMADKLPYRFANHAGMLGVLTVAGEKSRWRSAPTSWPHCATAPKTPSMTILWRGHHRASLL